MAEDMFHKHKWRFLMAWGAMMALVGCDEQKPMTNDQIIAETTKCQKAGMKAQPLMSEGTGPIFVIQCLPK